MRGRESIPEIRKALKRTWFVFFSMRDTLTPVQIEAIPKVLAGKNVVLATATASGKTEAVVAPIAERLLAEDWKGLAVLYVVPTKALANDIMERLRDPLSKLGISCRVRHGDQPHLPVGEKLPNVLITTPESLDSILCKRTGDLVSVKTVVLDEVHLVDNTYRGDQLRILLARLKKIAADPDFSVHILSATLSDPEKVAQRYVADFEVITASKQREIDSRTVASLSKAVQLAKDRGCKKLLCFCNLREKVEEVGQELQRLWSPYPVVVHHGSLGPTPRKYAEDVMKNEPVAACVATSTLEIGIDIGSIDLVIFAEIPWSRSSFMQRLGRANRRSNIIQAVAIAEDQNEELMFQWMVEAAVEGDLDQDAYRSDLSVVVQQVFSYLRQNPAGVTDEELVELVSPLALEMDVRLILTHLEEIGWIEYRRGAWQPTTHLLDFADESKGRIHGNIPDSREYRVVDQESGSEIGKIHRPFDGVFCLAGRVWKVTSADQRTVKVVPFSHDARPAEFKAHREEGAFFYYLPIGLRIWPEVLIPVARPPGGRSWV